MSKEEVWQVLDEAIEIELSGKKYKAHLLPIKTVFAWAEGKAVSDALVNIKKVADMLVGKEKVEYLAEATRTAIPSGMSLMESAKGVLYSMEALEETLFQALHKEHSDIGRDKIKQLVMENMETVGAIIPLLIKGDLSKKAQG